MDLLKNVSAVRHDQPWAGCHVLTFDVEEWFHARNLGVDRMRWSGFPSRLDKPIDTILALLAEHETHATFFVLGWVARRSPDLVRRIHRAGHEIASHGYGHRPIYEQTPAQFREDIHKSKSLLEEIIGTRVLGYRAPSYSIGPETDWALDILQDAGFAYDSSIYPTRAPHGRYGMPGTPLHPYRIRTGLWEFPLPTWRVLGWRVPAATGAYLRLAPLIVTRLAVNQNVRRGIPVVINLHPWELDPAQPRSAAPRWNRFLHYANLHTTQRKLSTLLGMYHFVRAYDLWRRCEPRPVSKPRREIIGSASGDGVRVRDPRRRQDESAPAASSTSR